MTTHTQARPLPGHTAVNLILALGIWTIGVYFTQATIPIDEEAGPIVPWVLAFIVQALLSMAQSNLRVFGATFDGWPLIVFVLLDVLINAAGLLTLTLDLTSLVDVWRYAVRAVFTGFGLWQCAGALFAGALIAAAPEQMVRVALKQRG